MFLILSSKSFMIYYNEGFGANYWRFSDINEQFSSVVNPVWFHTNIHIPWLTTNWPFYCTYKKNSQSVQIVVSTGQIRPPSNLIGTENYSGSIRSCQKSSRLATQPRRVSCMQSWAGDFCRTVPVNAISAELYTGAGQDWVTRGSSPQRWISLTPAHPAQVHLTVLKQVVGNRIRISQIDNSIFDVWVPISYFTIYPVY